MSPLMDGPVYRTMHVSFANNGKSEQRRVMLPAGYFVGWNSPHLQHRTSADYPTWEQARGVAGALARVLPDAHVTITPFYSRKGYDR